MSTAHQAGPRLVGETVTVSYVADPAFGHGRFRLENPGAVAVTAAVDAAWLELGGQRRPLAGVTVFDADRDSMVDPAGFTVAPGATMRFLAGFPRVAWEPGFGASCAVGLQLRVDGSEQAARSPLEFVRRIP